MKIGIAATFIEGFSGGRFHAFLLGAELAAQGHEVTFVCNRPPGFLDKLPPVPGHDRVRFVKLRFDLLRPPGPLVFGLWIVVQERSLNGRFFEPVFENARREATPMLLLTYETPNWQEAVLGSIGRSSHDALIVEAMRLGAQCLSSTREGQRWARDFFPGAPAERFHFLKPPILAASYPESVLRDPRLIVAFVRRSSLHKGFGTIVQFLDRRLAGWRVVLVDGHGITYEMRAMAALLRAREGVEVELRGGICEAEKFSLIKAARVLLFPSLFEGFGLPPGEARYWGTPVICYDLPVLREVYGDALRYVPHGDARAFGEELLRELATNPDFSPAASARHVGDLQRWRDEVAVLLENVMSRARSPEPLPRTSEMCDVKIVIADQLQNWSKQDTAAAAGVAIERCGVVSFGDELYARLRLEQIRQAVIPGEVLLPSGSGDENLRKRLLEAVEAAGTSWIFLTEDLTVCPGEVIRSAVATAASAGAEVAVIPSVTHYQEDGLRYHRTATGELIGVCGVFRRDFLLRCLRETDRPGSRCQPVIDTCFLVLMAGGRIVPAEGRAERLPPRDVDIEFDVLPGGAGTWHEAWRGRTGLDLLIEPLPCRVLDDSDELARRVAFRRLMLRVLADHARQRLDRRLLTDMASDLIGQCRVWRAAFDPKEPARTLHRIGGNYLRYGRSFMTGHHMDLFLECALAALAPDEAFDSLRRREVDVAPAIATVMVDERVRGSLARLLVLRSAYCLYEST